MNNQTIEFIRTVNQSGKRPATPQRWSVDEVEALFKLPFADLMFRAQQVHRENFDPNAVHLLRAEHQIGERQFEQGFDFVHAPALRSSGSFARLIDSTDEFDSLGVHKFFMFGMMRYI